MFQLRTAFVPIVRLLENRRNQRKHWAWHWPGNTPECQNNQPPRIAAPASSDSSSSPRRVLPNQSQSCKKLRNYFAERTTSGVVQSFAFESTVDMPVYGVDLRRNLTQRTREAGTILAPTNQTRITHRCADQSMPTVFYSISSARTTLKYFFRSCSSVLSYGVPVVLTS